MHSSTADNMAFVRNPTLQLHTNRWYLTMTTWCCSVIATSNILHNIGSPRIQYCSEAIKMMSYHSNMMLLWQQSYLYHLCHWNGDTTTRIMWQESCIFIPIFISSFKTDLKSNQYLGIPLVYPIFYWKSQWWCQILKIVIFSHCLSYYCPSKV